MTRVIVQQAFGLYVAAMASAVIRLVTLAAFILMPLTMSSTGFAAPQASQASAPGHHEVIAEHCGTSEDEDKAPAPSKMDCAAACAAIAPTGGLVAMAGLRPRAPRAIILATPVGDIVPEIATPPPRLG